VTCFGYFRFARAVLPHFHRQRSGHIINIASMLSEGAAPLLSAYSSAKHAVLGWSQCLRLELYHTGIDVSAVLVPSLATPMFDHAQMKLGHAPRPVPPTYDPDVAARAVVRVAVRPRPKTVPVFLQGTFILWLKRWLPFVGDFILGRWGVRMQMRPALKDPRRGNLFHPVPEGVGPRGSVPPTPRWLRWCAASGLFALAGSVAGAVGYAAWRVSRR
jgi:short chain dehydrogenase